MSEQQIDINYYRDKLTDLRQQLLKENQTGKEATKTVELDQSRVGRLSRMDAIQSQAMAVETKRRREIKIHRVQSAIKFRIVSRRGKMNLVTRCTQKCGLESGVA